MLVIFDSFLKIFSLCFKRDIYHHKTCPHCKHVGQNFPSQLLSLAGNCAFYEKELEIENAQAKLFQRLIAHGMPLPVQPIDPEKIALTYFWWDNFGCTKENLKGSIHTTHGVAFQEVSVGTKFTAERAFLEMPSGRRSLKVIGCDLPQFCINPHKPPNVFTRNALDSALPINKHFDYFLTF